jgi:hypothetical protein
MNSTYKAEFFHHPQEDSKQHINNMTEGMTRREFDCKIVESLDEEKVYLGRSRASPSLRIVLESRTQFLLYIYRNQRTFPSHAALKNYTYFSPSPFTLRSSL